jgi:MFS family permease
LVENEGEAPPASREVVAIISVLLIGVFISQADGTLVLSVYGRISSEFNDLENGSWIITAYLLAMSGTQALYGRLSEIYGRKRCLQASYILFSIGTLGTGIGQSLGQVIGARVIQGAGGAGMVGMVSILLTDLVPPRDVAVYRSYVNVISTVGRMSGGTFGGLISEVVGWRA